MVNRSIKALVSGRVQGVWYRDSTQKQAAALRITGYAKNLPDGNVEVVANGCAESIATLLRWLHQGPPSAIVKTVAVEEIEATHTTTFTVL